MPRTAEHKFEEFHRGMESSTDEFKLPRGAGVLASNVDTTRKPGKLCKPPGIKVFDFGGLNLWPPLGYENIEIVSGGVLRYKEVWDDLGEKSNLIKEMLVIQVYGAYDEARGFEWFEIEHTVGENDWVVRGPFFCDITDELNYSPEWEGAWGVTKAGRVRWKEKNGILRGAAGSFINADPDAPTYNTADSKPIWIGYINRMPTDPADGDVNGFFQIYDSAAGNDGHCLLGGKGLYRGIGIPDYTPEFELLTHEVQAPFDSWLIGNDLGYAESADLQYIVLAVYDGHQIAPLKIEPIHKHEEVTADSYFTWVTKPRIKITDYESLDSFPRRLSGFMVYRAARLWGITSGAPHAEGKIFTDYELIADIDIRAGCENIYSAIGDMEFTSGTTPQGDDYNVQVQVKMNWNWSYQTMPVNLFQHLFIQIVNNEGNTEEYPIVWTTPNGANQLLSFFFNVADTGKFTDSGTYNITVNSRWQKNDADVEIYFVDFNDILGGSPPWVVVNKELDEQPEILCNYGIQEFYKNMHIVTDIAFKDERYRTMIRNSHEIGHVYAGSDIYPNEHFIPTTEDDEVRGIMDHLDYIYVITKNGKIYRFLVTESGWYLQAQHWNTGLDAVDSLICVNGIYYLFGIQGVQRSVFVAKSISQPYDLGHRNKKMLEEYFALPNARPDLTYAFPLPGEKKIIMSMPEFVGDS